jgi:PIN like domain
LTPVFFTDRDLGNQFGDILRAASLIVERHGDHFPPNCPDEIWLHEVGLRGWIAITHNRRIRHTPNELASVIEHNVALLVVIGAAPYADLARAFVNTYPRIEAFLRGHVPPFIAKVYRPTPADTARRSDAPGRIELWYPRP